MSSQFDGPLDPPDTNPQTQWNEDTLADPFAGFRDQFWQRTAQPSSSSSGLLSSFSKPQSLFADALTAGGFASRMLGESPLTMEMSWGLTAAGRVLTSYAQSDHNSADATSLIIPPYTVPSNKPR